MIFFLLLFQLFALSTNAAEFRWNLRNHVDNKSIGDNEFKFKTGEWDCSVAELKKNDDSKFETRRLSCSVNNGLQVYLDVSCGSLPESTYKNSEDSQTILLQQKNSGTKSVTLFCSK